MTDNSTYCVNPYMNLSIHPKGVVKPCCMSTRKFVTDSGDTTINNASILEFWNSNDRQQMINSLNAGIKIPDCAACWQEEDAGKESKRIRDNKTYANLNTDNDMLPVVLDLSMGNLCNLKCRICGPDHSTSWMIEEASIHFPNNKQAYFKQPKWKNIKGSFDYENKFLWDDIIALLPNVTKFDFAGGEPFYIEKHWSIVNKCVEEGWSKKQHIHYNTNGTIYPEKYMLLLEEFRLVDIQISSDGVGKKFEYCRHPAVWEEVEENINKFISAKNNSNTEWLLSTCISISAFNVYDFFETFEHYASKGMSIYVNMVHDHHGVKVLPRELKETVINKLNSLESKYLPHQWNKDRNMVIQHLSNTESIESEWINFWTELEMRDTIRKESFKETFPEYYNEIKKYL